MECKMSIEEVIGNVYKEKIIKAVFSDLRQKIYPHKKTILWRIGEGDGDVYYQFEGFTEEQVFHTNVDKEKVVERMVEMASHYKQIQITTAQQQWSIRLSKKGKVHLTNKALTSKVAYREHNAKKTYILEEGKPIDFLVALGIMDENGQITKKRYDKFRQINRYLEFVRDSLDELDTQTPTIIDFGCGKSYLTFALYYYLVYMKKMNITLIGLDLKKSVIQNLNQLKDQLGYNQLEFRVGDIAMFEYNQPIDMVISLHACDVATDYALEKAIKWGAKVIMAVPCCHKEIQRQIQTKHVDMEGVLHYGLLKERIAALITDGLRGEILKSSGYEVQIMEFIDMEHTPKNIMIRGYKRHKSTDLTAEYKKICQQYGLEPMLEKLLKV